MKKYFKYITCLIVSLLLITTCFATDVDTETVVENTVPDFSQFYSSTFLITELEGNYYAYTCLPQYNLYLSSSTGKIYIKANPSIVEKYKFVDGDWKLIANNSSSDSNYFRVIYTTTGYSETFLYSNCDITYVNSEGVYFKQNINNDNIPDEDDTDIVTSDTDISSSIVSDEETKGVLYMILGILIFFLICVLCTYIYKFFKMFF